MMKFLFKAAMALLGVVLLIEFALRLGGYHLTVKYQREGDLLFAPRPNQAVTEKIALTPTRVNNYGVRGEDYDESALKERTVILCLGDSIVYGYGVDDQSTYPDFVQKTLEQSSRDKFLVVNAGVNAYPVALMRERYLKLRERGIDPDYVVIGYSMNEGWLGRISEGSEELKGAFEKRILLKNTLRSIGLYNLVIENWARTYYDRFKGRFIPGTNQVSREGVADGEAQADASEILSNTELYTRSLDRIAETLKENSRIKKVFAVCSAAHNATTDEYDTRSELQLLFKEAAAKHGWVLIPSDEVLREQTPEGSLGRYFIDRCHMTAEGNEVVGAALGRLIFQSEEASSHP